MDDLLRYSLLLVTGFFTGVLNIMAGGGSVLTLPALIYIGLDPNIANGTNRIFILMQNLTAVVAFSNEKMSYFKQSFRLAIFTIPGAIIGAFLAVKIEGELFVKILGVVTIILSLLMLAPIKHKPGVADENHPKFILYPLLFAIGFYGGFIQAGIGIFIMFVLRSILKFDLVKVNVYKVFIAFIFTIPAFFIFIYHGQIDWGAGFVLGLGSILGAWVSAKVVSKLGEKVVKAVLVVSSLLIALNLLGVF
ncbi:MAG: sulfite exporter TauE/SafE family protein [Ignavibacteriales bacterium]|nr:MAG: sulfite exporter TauE/SafE family protein [Ignavibacteriaceae bacterium]MBW7873137.1 sulfite exporter TauE/SafE family protein [Ignavibacteria bacterium]MBZ0196284.1 sulfite exporter TauE/SafE family protein [Ignavibacteriaceae bacterium]MCZ2142779.1 sulfite exporter TauE/SafE family protein [Ignavibacteriales bacterium]WKZ71458.1 MAG: sulfite exporter TauE/SafE family protein [Ignavibacteriaceae bacterium]